MRRPHRSRPSETRPRARRRSTRRSARATAAARPPKSTQRPPPTPHRQTKPAASEPRVPPRPSRMPMCAWAAPHRAAKQAWTRPAPAVPEGRSRRRPEGSMRTQQGRCMGQRRHPRRPTAAIARGSAAPWSVSSAGRGAPCQPGRSEVHGGHGRSPRRPVPADLRPARRRRSSL